MSSYLWDFWVDKNTMKMKSSIHTRRHKSSSRYLGRIPIAQSWASLERVYVYIICSVRDFYKVTLENEAKKKKNLCVSRVTGFMMWILHESVIHENIASIATSRLLLVTLFRDWWREKECQRRSSWFWAYPWYQLYSQPQCNTMGTSR